jgi:hypothetical protein
MQKCSNASATMGTATSHRSIGASTPRASTTITPTLTSPHPAVPRHGVHLVIGWTAVIWMAIVAGYAVSLWQPSQASSSSVDRDGISSSSSFASWIWPINKNDGTAANKWAAVVPPIEIPEYTSIQDKVGSAQERWLHPDLFPLTAQTIVGFVCSALALMIAAGGGIGGGGVLVPIYILIMGFSPKYAIPLSNVTILGEHPKHVYGSTA